MCPFKIFPLALILLFTLQGCLAAEENFNFSCSELLVTSNGDKVSARAADYLYNQLSSRNRDSKNFSIDRTDDLNSLKQTQRPSLYIEVVDDLKTDYQLLVTETKISVYLKDINSIAWFTYQFTDILAGYKSINASDLPPAYISLENSSKNFSFTYREPHILPNSDETFSAVHYTHSIDRDWGLWGHNMEKVFGGTVPAQSYASINSKRSEDQFCFSSEETYRALTSYIMDQYGNGSKQGTRFMVAPEDNNLVCTCSSCSKLGNTNQNNTPAIIYLINRLAGQFPHHKFYTISYQTTKQTSGEPLANNTGVFLSTIDLPKKPILSESDSLVSSFVHAVGSWKEKSDDILLWDYIANFDDYLTPYPVLKRFQSQLHLYKELGVSGLFLNGAGYDFSPFDDLKMYVFSALMIDHTLDVDRLVQNYYEKFYPRSGKAISDYILAMENDARTKNYDTGIYTSFRQAKEVYFNPWDFENLYQQLSDISKHCVGEEKKKLSAILVGMSYTMLQISYHDNSTKNTNDLPARNLNGNSSTGKYLDLLKSYPSISALKRYKEEGGEIDEYIKEWEDQGLTDLPQSKIVLLKNKSFTNSSTPLDINLLVDSKKGFASDFNQGWFLSGDNLDLVFKSVSSLTAPINLKARFLLVNRHRMLTPDYIDIFINDKFFKRIKGEDLELQNKNTAVLNVKIPVNQEAEIKLHIIKNKTIKNSVIACDEIYAF